MLAFLEILPVSLEDHAYLQAAIGVPAAVGHETMHAVVELAVELAGGERFRPLRRAADACALQGDCSRKPSLLIDVS